MNSRSVDDQSVPLSFDVVVWRLLRDVEAGKLQLPGDFLLPFEHNQRNLGHKDTILWGKFPPSEDFQWYHTQFLWLYLHFGWRESSLFAAKLFELSALNIYSNEVVQTNRLHVLLLPVLLPLMTTGANRVGAGDFKWGFCMCNCFCPFGVCRCKSQFARSIRI